MSDPLLTLVAPEPRRSGGGALAGLVVVGVLAAGVFGVLDRIGDAADATLGGPATAVDLQAPAPAPADVPAAAAAVPAVDAAPRAPSAPLPLGTAAGLALSVPGLDPVLVSYHEASYAEAWPIAPAGTVAHNDNPTRAYDVLGGDGPAYGVQVSRGRVQGPTSAVDVVLRAGDAVLAPVAGTVTEVRPYLLYGQHEDVRVELQPDGRPDLRVVLIHVEGVVVRTGDLVEVGDALAAGARAFPFEAVVDRRTAPERHGHVHLEVKSPGDDPDPDHGGD